MRAGQGEGEDNAVQVQTRSDQTRSEQTGPDLGG